MIAPNVVEVNVDAARRQPLERLPRALLLVHESVIKTQFLRDELQLLGGPDRSDHAQPLSLRKLADDLPDAARRGGYEDGLSRLRPANLVERRVRCQAGDT
jgi:hypothetical protein